MHLLLVHGSFHGPWCWTPLKEHLPKEWSVTVPGLAMGDPAITLGDHVTALSGAIATVSGERLVIVAHSYAGMVLPAAMAKARRPLHQAIYLDAFLPEAGESAFALLGPMADGLRASAAGGMMQPPPPQAFGVERQADLEWMASQLLPMPVQTHEAAAPVSAFANAAGRSMYLRCTRFPGFAAMERRAQLAGWPTRALDAGHDAMITAPESLARLLLELVDTPV